MERYFDVNSGGHSIRCKLYCNHPRDIADVVLCGHGFAGHKDNKSTERFAENVLSKYKKAAVLIFDWPCHGKDVKKKLSLADCDAYLGAVLDYVRNEMGVSRIQGYANSFGGYLFLKYVAEHGNPFESLALRSPAINIYESLMNRIMNSDNLEQLEKGRDAEVGFDRKIGVSQQFLDELRAADIRKLDYLDECEKILILHGTADEIIPFEVSSEFAEENLIELIPVAGADHRIQDPAAMGNVIRDVLRFFRI